jgi:hypothetical protein
MNWYVILEIFLTYIRENGHFFLVHFRLNISYQEHGLIDGQIFIMSENMVPQE